ncbi:hypothetical protein OKW46_002233 [Paraburkholderia sp. WSM4179]|nr:hypothetical protein [Paraburkholderia sp. WSM4179]
MQHDACRIGMQACHMKRPQVGTAGEYVYQCNTRCVISPVSTHFALNWPVCTVSNV